MMMKSDYTTIFNKVFEVFEEEEADLLDMYHVASCLLEVSKQQIIDMLGELSDDLDNILEALKGEAESE